MATPLTNWLGPTLVQASCTIRADDGRLFRIDIDVHLPNIVRQLSRRAVANKSKRAAFLKSAVIVEARRIPQGDQS